MKLITNEPETFHIASSNILSFLNELENKHIPMHSFMLYCKDSILAEGYYAPYKKDSLHRMFSISKSFTAIAIGLLEAEGTITLSDPIIKYFPDKLPTHVHPWIAELTIEQMLMMRTCHASTTYKGHTNDWTGSFFTTTPTHKPGTIFHYDTSSAHVLCDLVERLTKMPMLDYIKMKLPELSFSKESYMIKDPDGVSLGGSGLVATTEDLLKFGLLLLKEGNIDGKQLVPSSYIRRATSCLTQTFVTGPLPSESCGYGYMIWRTEKNGFVCYGMGGQFIIVCPKEELILITTADTQGIAGGNQIIYDSFYKNILTPYCDASYCIDTHDSGAQRAQLLAKLSTLRILPVLSFDEGNHFALTSPKAVQMNGKTFFVVNDIDNLSKSAQNVSGFNYFSFDFTDTTKAHLSFGLNGQSHQLTFGFHELALGQFPIYDLSYAANAVWLDENTLYIRFHIIDEYLGSVHMQFYFGDTDVTVYMKKIEESCFQEFNGHFYGTL